MLIQPTTYQTTNPNFGKVGKLGKALGRGATNSFNKNPYLEKLEKLEIWYNKEIELIYHNKDSATINNEIKELDKKYYEKLQLLENKYGFNVAWLRRLLGT